MHVEVELTSKKVAENETVSAYAPYVSDFVGIKVAENETVSAYAPYVCDSLGIQVAN